MMYKREKCVEWGKNSRHQLDLFLEKFIDKYNDFIQYLNTHIILILTVLSVCLYACPSLRQSIREHMSGYILHLISMTLVAAQWAKANSYYIV